VSGIHEKHAESSNAHDEASKRPHVKASFRMVRVTCETDSDEELEDTRRLMRVGVFVWRSCMGIVVRAALYGSVCMRSLFGIPFMRISVWWSLILGVGVVVRGGSPR
jgi:hypothetical protein